MYQETEHCDLKFNLNTFKCGLPSDNSGIYNSLTKFPPYTFDELLSRINEYARVEDNEIAQMVGMKGRCWNGKFDNSKRKRTEELNKVSKDGYKWVNTAFTKPNYKIMFDIQHKPLFEWPRLMGGQP